MEITIHRGTKEVGGSCVELRSGKSRIILDAGMPLFDEERQALDSFAMRRMSKEELRDEGILPDVPGLFDDNGNLDGILLSHAHLDHTGLLNHSHPEIPVYASGGTSKMMLAGKLFAGQVELPRERFREIVPETPVTIGEFTVTGFSVDHSIYGCLALLIEANGKTVLYTGDLRLHGRKPGMNRRLIEVVSKRTVDALLMEGTHFGLPDGPSSNEYELEAEITNHVRESKALVLASFSPQHIDRLVAFIRAAKKTDRTFVADLYTAFILHLLSSEGSLPVPGKDGCIAVYVPKFLETSAKRRGFQRLIDRFENARVELPTIQANPRNHLMIFRPSMLADFGGILPPETTCLYSRWTGYLKHPEWKPVTETLRETSGRLIEVHTSGHILSSDIAGFVKAVAPKSVIPIHTFEPKAFQQYFDNVLVLDDGTAVQIP